MVETRTHSKRRRPLSPNVLPPPTWGQAVAPPPTPFFASPNSSPPEVIESRKHQRRHNCSHAHHQRRPMRSRANCESDLWSSHESGLVTYSYRFSGHNLSQIHRQEVPFSHHLGRYHHHSSRQQQLLSPANSASVSPISSKEGSSPGDLDSIRNCRCFTNGPFYRHIIL